MQPNPQHHRAYQQAHRALYDIARNPDATATQRLDARREMARITRQQLQHESKNYHARNQAFARFVRRLDLLITRLQEYPSPIRGLHDLQQTLHQARIILEIPSDTQETRETTPGRDR